MGNLFFPAHKVYTERSRSYVAAAKVAQLKFAFQSKHTCLKALPSAQVQLSLRRKGLNRSHQQLIQLTRCRIGIIFKLGRAQWWRWWPLSCQLPTSARKWPLSFFQQYSSSFLMMTSKMHCWYAGGLKKKKTSQEWKTALTSQYKTLFCSLSFLPFCLFIFFVFFVFLSFCLHITLIKCLKGLKS